MPQAFSAALFEQIFALWCEVVVHLRQAAATRKDAENRALKSVQLGKTHGYRRAGVVGRTEKNNTAAAAVLRRTAGKPRKFPVFGRRCGK